MSVLYHVEFSSASGKVTHLATVPAREAPGAFCAYHLAGGRHLVPDYSAIRDALPRYHRAAYDRAMGARNGWWYPSGGPQRAITAQRDIRTSCSLPLRDRRGRHLGTVYAIPVLSAAEGATM